jgi:histone-lysine N-methyltransferase SETD3
MFDFENAEKCLKKCFSLDSKSKTNTKLKNILSNKTKEINENKKKNKHYEDYIFFMKYLYSQGLFLNKITINFNNESNRCVISTEEIKEKEILLRIPLNALITLDDAQNSDIGKYFDSNLKKMLNGPNHSLLSSFILYEMEKKTNSKWLFYFNFLPSNYNNFPIFFSESELKHLKGTQFLTIVQNKKKEMKEDYDLLCSKIPYYSNYKYLDFCKVREIVSSRIFGVIIHGKKNDIIAPYADMLNHKRPRETHWTYDDKLDSFVVSAISDIKQSNEVFDSYGRKCNSRFLLNYGFTIENNEDNEYKINLELDESCPLFTEKKRDFIILNPKKFVLSKNLNEKNVLNFFAFMRYLVYEKNDFKFVNFNNFISIDNERNVMLKLKNIIINELKNYSTTLEDDQKYLEQNKKKISFNEYNCYIIRIGEKNLLNFYLTLANLCLDLFNKEKNEIYNIINSQKKIFLPYNGYLTELLK